MEKSDLIELVSFKVGSSLLAAPISKIQEIIRYKGVVVIPQSPSFVNGVINLRGKIIPVIDLQKKLGIDGDYTSDKERIVVCEIGGVRVGLKANEVLQVLRVSPESIEVPPEAVSEVKQHLLQGIVNKGETMLLILNLDTVLTDPEIDILREAKQPAP
ncbi:MAG: chemotaxis protein CheW [Candidatus Omnitrophota bacterium]